MICVIPITVKFSNSTVLLLHESLLWQHQSHMTNFRQNHINCALVLSSAESCPDSLTKLNMKKCKEAAGQLCLYRQS